MLGAALKVKMKRGQEFASSVDFPDGYPFSNPMSKERILDKFRSNIKFSQMISMDNAEEWLNLMEELEELDNVRDMIKLLVP